MEMQNIFLFFCSLAIVFGDNIPVLMWTNTDTHFPTVPLGQKLDKSVFAQNFINPQSENHLLVTFLQDKLSLDDLTLHGDVYDSYAEGGAFHNLKHLLESHSSAQLDNVEKPADILSRSTSDRIVHTLSSPYDLASLDLKPGVQHSVIVELPKLPADSVAMRKAYAHSDAIIGTVAHQLTELNKPYTAVYTSKSSMSNGGHSEHHSGRTLLQAQEYGSPSENNSSYIHFNGTCISVYLEEIIVEISHYVVSVPLPSRSIEVTPTSCTTANSSFEYTFSDVSINISSLVMKMNFEIDGFYWYMSSLTIDVKDPITLAPLFDKVFAPHEQSYSCPETPPFQNINFTGDSSISVVLGGFQVQYSNSNGTALQKFGRPNSCVGFFSVSILSGLLVAALLIGILTFGICMIANIQTMDRFDNPKGKGITVNTGD